MRESGRYDMNRPSTAPVRFQRMYYVHLPTGSVAPCLEICSDLKIKPRKVFFKHKKYVYGTQRLVRLRLTKHHLAFQPNKKAPLIADAQAYTLRQSGS